MDSEEGSEPTLPLPVPPPPLARLGRQLMNISPLTPLMNVADETVDFQAARAAAWCDAAAVIVNHLRDIAVADIAEVAAAAFAAIAIDVFGFGVTPNFVYQ